MWPAHLLQERRYSLESLHILLPICHIAFTHKAILDFEFPVSKREKVSVDNVELCKLPFVRTDPAPHYTKSIIKYHAKKMHVLCLMCLIKLGLVWFYLSS